MRVGRDETVPGKVFADGRHAAGAHGAGDMLARADAALAAGCEMVLACNDASAADLLLARWRPAPPQELARRAAAMCGRLPGACPL